MVRARDSGGTVGGIPDAGVGTGASFGGGSIGKEEGCETIAGLAGASGSYATSEAAGGTNGFADNSHLSSALRLCLVGIRVWPVPQEGLHRQAARSHACDERLKSVVVAMWGFGREHVVQSRYSVAPGRANLLSF
jgi:hypothetical protein